MSNNKSRSLNKCFHCSQITGQVVLGDGLFFCYHCSKPYAGEDDNKDEEEELVLLQPSRDVVPVSSERSGIDQDGQSDALTFSDFFNQ
ncbi:unnamed protein product [Mucor fragilis]